MRQKRLLAILSRYLWPVDGGRKESLNHYFKELHDTYGYEIKLMCFMEYGQKVDKKDFPFYISEVIPLQEISFFEKIKNVLLKTLGKTQWPFQCSFYYSYNNSQKIKKIVDDWKPDVVFTEMIRTCVYYDVIKSNGALLLSNLDDLLSLRYLRQAQSERSKACFTGNYTNKLPRSAVRFLNGSFMKKFVLKMEATRCERWEKEYYKLFDFTLMTSNLERDQLNQMMNSDKAKTLSVGIDYEYYSQEINVEKDPIGLSYLGNFNVAANADTLEMIVNDILPYIKSDYHFYLIGKCPDYILEKYKNNHNLFFLGRVDDLREYVKKATIFLAPIAYGTGIKTKIVEAMAMKMPVITNEVGAEGIHAISGKEYIVCNNPVEIAGAVDELLDDTQKAIDMGIMAGQFAYEHFRWAKVLEVYKELGI